MWRRPPADRRRRMGSRASGAPRRGTRAARAGHEGARRCVRCSRCPLPGWESRAGRRALSSSGAGAPRCRHRAPPARPAQFRTAPWSGTGSRPAHPPRQVAKVSACRLLPMGQEQPPERWSNNGPGAVTLSRERRCRGRTERDPGPNQRAQARHRLGQRLGAGVQHQFWRCGSLVRRADARELRDLRRPGLWRRGPSRRAPRTPRAACRRAPRRSARRRRLPARPRVRRETAR